MGIVAEKQSARMIATAILTTSFGSPESRVVAASPNRISEVLVRL